MPHALLLATIAPVILALWVIGALRRLRRLRADLAAALAPVDELLRQHDEWLQEAASAPSAGRRRSPERERVRASGRQLLAVLSRWREQPASAEWARRTGMALAIVDRCWGGFEQSRRLSGAERIRIQTTRAAQREQIVRAAGRFNEAVALHNRAVRRWPTRIVAWAFRRTPAAPLALSPGDH